MRWRSLWPVGLLIVAAPVLGACNGAHEEEAVKEEPAKVESIKGSDLNRLTLLPKAAERIGIQTAPVRETSLADGTPRAVVEYSAVDYDPEGGTSVYTNPEPLVFIRQPVTVDHVDGDQVLLADGPPAGTQVVTVGAAELFGIEFGIGEFE